jgi:hypothetical protein
VIPTLLVSLILLAPQGQGVDLDKVLEKADKLLEESKAAYENGREKASTASFLDAGFKLEEARIKYIVLQEIGGPERQKTAADRLRAVNQLAKLIHDGKVAISGAAVGGAPAPAPADPAAKPDVAKAPDRPDAPNALALQPPADVRVRLPVPDLAKQRDAERIIKDIYKDQYAKKATADRILLARLLLEQTAQMGNDPAALWVLYREAQDAAAQVCDLKTLQASIDGASAHFDVDTLALKNTALTNAAKNAKTPAEFAGLTRALIELVDEYVAADQYDLADKTAAAALFTARKTSDVPLAVKVTNRARDVAEAKTRFIAMKGALETLAKNPDDPAANNEMGQMLCFVKGNWDLGIRFLVKGSDPVLKSLAEKELALSLEALDQVAIADGWWDLAEKEKSPLRKTLMQQHARGFYEAAYPAVSALMRIKIERRIGAVEAPALAGSINLLKMIDLSKDAIRGTWTQDANGLKVKSEQWARLEIPYEPPAEYDFRIVFVRTEGTGDAMQVLNKNGHQFIWSLGCAANTMMGFGFINGGWVHEPSNPTRRVVPSVLTNGKSATSLVQVRNDGLKAFLDGKLIVGYPTTYQELSPHPDGAMRSPTNLGICSWSSGITFTQVDVVEVTGKGRKTR